MATTETTQSDEVELTAEQRAEQRAEAALYDALIDDGTGTVGDMLTMVEAARDVLMKIQDALGPQHFVSAVNVNADRLVLSVDLSEFNR